MPVDQTSPDEQDLDIRPSIFRKEISSDQVRSSLPFSAKTIGTPTKITEH